MPGSFHEDFIAIGQEVPLSPSTFFTPQLHERTEKINRQTPMEVEVQKERIIAERKKKKTQHKVEKDTGKSGNAKGQVDADAWYADEENDGFLPTLKSLPKKMPFQAQNISGGQHGKKKSDSKDKTIQSIQNEESELEVTTVVPSYDENTTKMQINSENIPRKAKKRDKARNLQPIDQNLAHEVQHQISIGSNRDLDINVERPSSLERRPDDIYLGELKVNQGSKRTSIDSSIVDKSTKQSETVDNRLNLGMNALPQLGELKLTKKSDIRRKSRSELQPLEERATTGKKELASLQLKGPINVAPILAPLSLEKGQSINDASTSKPKKEKKSKFVIAQYDYEAIHNDELTFKAGDVIRFIKKEEDMWSLGELKGIRGLFPVNYVQKYKETAEDL